MAPRDQSPTPRPRRDGAAGQRGASNTPRGDKNAAAGGPRSGKRQEGASRFEGRKRGDGTGRFEDREQSKGKERFPAKKRDSEGGAEFPARAGKGRKRADAPRKTGRQEFFSLGQKKGPKKSDDAAGKRGKRPRPAKPLVDTFGTERDPHREEGVRLQKVLANAGVASRRVCEQMILEGRVSVDGTPVLELGTRINPAEVAIHVDGKRVQTDEDTKYFAFNKPRGVVTTMEDPEGRPCIGDYVRKGGPRLFHVGRLDVDTEGLIILTNDGEFAHRLAHPSYQVPKTYLVQTKAPLPYTVGKAMIQGVELEDGVTSVDSFRIIDALPQQVLVEVVLHSGKNRIVRRLFDALGFPIQKLVRTHVGEIALGNQRPGTLRALGRTEIAELMSEVGM